MDDWVVGLTDITDQVRELRLAARSDPSLLPREHPYPLPDDVALTVGADLA